VIEHSFEHRGVDLSKEEHDGLHLLGNTAYVMAHHDTVNIDSPNISESYHCSIGKRTVLHLVAPEEINRCLGYLLTALHEAS
jgi:hypothetical protein